MSAKAQKGDSGAADHQGSQERKGSLESEMGERGVQRQDFLRPAPLLGGQTLPKGKVPAGPLPEVTTSATHSLHSCAQSLYRLQIQGRQGSQPGKPKQSVGGSAVLKRF